MNKESSKFEYAPAPKYAPKRDLSYLTEGDEIAWLMRFAGRELMPWQRQVIDIATEYRIIGPGESQNDRHLGRRGYKYSHVLITVPRQSGKTTLMGPVKLHRLMTRPGISAFSTAQTGKDAGKRMHDLINWVGGTPLNQIFKGRRSNGSEGLTCSANGSTLTRFAPMVGAIHGETTHFVDFDEIWKYTEALGDNLLGGASPAMITLRPTAQIWMISTMGTSQSTFMNKWVHAGRNGTDPSLAYFEWSMPTGEDPYDSKTWWMFHPALGNTIGEDALQAETSIPYAEWMRAYMNVLTEAENPVIPTEDWKELAAIPPAETPDIKDVTISYEVAPNNERAAVMASWRDSIGAPCSRVLHSAPGAVWLPDYIRRLAADWEPRAIAADDGGPTRRVTDELTNPPDGIEPLEVFTLGMRDYSTACEAWLSAARDEKTLRPDTTQAFARAVSHIALRTTNGATRVDRDRSTGPVPEVIASAVGIWAYDHQEAEVGLQIF